MITSLHNGMTHRFEFLFVIVTYLSLIRILQLLPGHVHFNLKVWKLIGNTFVLKLRSGLQLDVCPSIFFN